MKRPALVFTDGSVIKGMAGWAYIGKKSGCGRFESNDAYEAELMAVCKALESAEGEICIVCDHWGIVEELRQLMAGKHEIKKAGWIWDRIEAASHNMVGVEWMKRMSTHEQRLADSTANRMAR